MPRPHPPWLLALLAALGLALLLGFLGLGTWQVQRRAWKLDLIARVAQRLHAAPTALPPAAQWPALAVADYEYRPVQAEGRWLPAHTVLTQATTAQGAGFWVLTPLQLDSGGTLLVNRGFIPQAQRAQWQPDPTPASPPVRVQGLLRASEPGGGFLRRNDPAQQRWHSRDVAAIAQAQGLAQTAPFFLDAGIPDASPPAPAEGALPAGPWPYPGLTVVRFSNSHLAYAFTWYGLALLTVVACVLVARYELRLRAAAGPLSPDAAQP